MFCLLVLKDNHFVKVAGSSHRDHSIDIERANTLYHSTLYALSFYMCITSAEDQKFDCFK
jgi:hypothetical protein